MKRRLVQLLCGAVLVPGLAASAWADEPDAQGLALSATMGSDVAERLRYNPSSRLYAVACGGCHYKGAGRADFGARSPAGKSSPDELVRAILFGKEDDDGKPGGGMPAFARVLTDAEIAGLARYLRSTRTTSGPWQDLEQGVAARRRAGDVD